ncbi:MAG: phosphoribosyl-AMP cyclohydrolase [Pseudomonadota bacterium]
MAPFQSPSPNPEIQEHGQVFRPKFDASGLLTAVAVRADTQEILMVAHMDAVALRETLSTGYAHYFSRSRQTLWKKGETSGQLQHVREILVDCDQDALILRVDVGGDGGACHTGARNCFFRTIGRDGALHNREP